MSHHTLPLISAPIPRQRLAALILPALLLLPGCAAKTSYMGINFAQSRAETQLQALARRAQAGNKQAQLALGTRFEAGIGVPLDIKRARKLYRLAATTTGGTIYVYVPPATRGGKGSVTPVNNGQRNEGLSEARERLRALDAISPETVMRRRLDYLIRCIRTAYRCDITASIALFHSALPAVTDDEARQKLAEQIADRSRRPTILSLIRRSDNRYDASIAYVGLTRGDCDPAYRTTRSQRLCDADPSARPLRETWRITIGSDGSLNIAIDALEKVAMGGAAQKGWCEGGALA